MFHTQWNTGLEVWFWIAIVLLAIVAIWFTISMFVMFTGDEYGGGAISAFIAAVVGIIVIGVSVFVFWPPFQTKYYKYYPVTGAVQNTPQSRFLSDGSGGTSQNYLIVIRGQDYRCDDTRCAQLKKGTVVTLMCAPSWAANGMPGWTCNWGKLGLNN